MIADGQEATAGSEPAVASAGDARIDRILRVIAAVLLLAAAATAIVPSMLRGSDPRYAAGDILRRSGDEEPYGVVLRYDPRHGFSNGRSSAAYELRLYHGDRTVWFTRETVDKAMTRVEAETANREAKRR